MNFFKHFNKVDYLGKDAINITNSILPKFKNINNTSMYFFHVIEDGDTPESISFEAYNDVEYHWVISLLNTIVDPYFQWALDNKEMTAWLIDKYGDDLNDIHHFSYQGRNIFADQSIEISGGWLHYNELYNDWKAGNPLPQNVYILSNTDYENIKNDERREIKLLKPELIDRFVSQFIDLMKGNYSNNTI